ncbi:hypothetical protein Daus18300_011117 [Diaporthe australafricana]|uniref:Microbial-type PARG catalytic domain-containing protein n=1 Tax=Diaporthe australafricana TaxID=127596 RepID=A0ABR3W7Q0_9PEZI
MGRTEPSVGRPPRAFRRDARAKKARATINKSMPALLSAHPRARLGIETAELIASPPKNASAGPKDISRPGRGLRSVLRIADTLTAARGLLSSPANNTQKVSVLNMASPLSPGGGFLNGATSQEESLCMHTTLLPSLRDEFYRLPELGCVYTPDVLVFRDSEGGDLHKKDRWFVDIVSAAMLRLPETEFDEATGWGIYVHQKDREMVLEKMKVIMRVFQAKGATHVVLGAWGCGAYGNPIGEIARAWRTVLLGAQKGKKGSEAWDGIEQVVFAISDAGMAEAFKEAFGEGLAWEEEPDQDNLGDRTEIEEVPMEELQARVIELEIRIGRAPDGPVKQGLKAVLATLKGQIPGQTFLTSIHHPENNSSIGSM